MNSAAEIWKIILNLLEKEKSATSVSVWFREIEPVSLDEDQFILCCPTDFKREILQTRYLKVLEDAFFELFSQHIHVQIISPAQRDNLSREGQGSGCTTVKEHYTFDRFVVGASNSLAYNAAQAVAENPGGAYNPFFIYGEPGLGKTHLLYAIYNAVKKAHPEYGIVVVTGEEFTNEVTEAIRRKSTDLLREKYRDKEMLLVDDIQFIAGKDATQIEFFNTFNNLHKEGHQIVLVSDRPPSDMIRLEERLRSRFEMGLIIDIQPPEYETRLAIVREKACQLNLDLPDVVLEFIAKNITDNVRQIEGAVTKMMALTNLTGAPVDNDTLMRALNELLKDKDSFMPSPDVIIQATSKCYGIDVTDILSQSRTREIVIARQVAMLVIRQMTKLSMPEIGKIFGRDHSTVVHSLEKVERLMKEDRATAENVRDIKSNVTSRSC